MTDATPTQPQAPAREAWTAPSEPAKPAQPKTPEANTPSAPSRRDNPNHRVKVGDKVEVLERVFCYKYSNLVGRQDIYLEPAVYTVNAIENDNFRVSGERRTFWIDGSTKLRLL